MKFLVFLTLLILAPALAKAPNPPLRIAIVDTGLNLNDPRFKDHLCPGGHKDFVGKGLKDKVGHGTHVTGIISKIAGDRNYCLLIYKYFDTFAPGNITVKREVKAFQEAIDNGATIINFSGGGAEFNEQEYLMIKNNPTVTFVVAAGNENKNIETEEGHYYPASYLLNNMVVVGNVGNDNLKAETSNWAYRPIQWENGVDVLSTLPNNKTGFKTGTSMATAIYTGKLIRRILDATKQPVSKQGYKIKETW